MTSSERESSPESSVFDDASFQALVFTVKALQKHWNSVKDAWNTYVETECKENPMHDPSRHSKFVLAKFLKRVVGEANEGCTGEQRRVKHFIMRCISWHQKAEGPDEHLLTSDMIDSIEGPVHPAWALVLQTQSHANFSFYKFNSYCLGWARSQRVPPDLTKPPVLLAMDCEMCTTDREQRALLCVCVVDEQGNTVLKEMVKPRGTVVDYMTTVTGITAEDMQDVKMKRKHIRRAVKALLTRNTVMVGHALHHDLNAVKVDHRLVIDTALLYTYKDLPECTPALKDLAKNLLGKEMRKGESGVHDAQEDAYMSMLLCLRQMQLGGPILPLDPPDIKVDKEELKKLFVHSLPVGTDEEKLREMLVVPGGASCVSFDGDFAARKVHAVYKHAGEANDVFKKLKGTQLHDSVGRVYKEVPVGPGTIIKVRKMACHGGKLFGKVPDKDKKRRLKEWIASQAAAKRRRTGGDAGKRGVRDTNKGKAGDEDTARAVNGREGKGASVGKAGNAPLIVTV